MTDICSEENSVKIVITEVNMTNGAEVESEHNDSVENTKAGLSRSASCGSILQANGVNKLKNLSRRVSFPSDDKLISGYNEPRNPWEQAHGTTTEDLIQAYTQACQSWNVKPITKLLLQLQEIKDFTVRANSLTLKGEKLEMRVVETLESIFKRVQFITIDLEATSLEEDSAAPLFDMIEYYESAVNVLVGFNKNLGTRGWQAAAHMMRKMSCLRLFDGHSVTLSMQAAPFVGRALRLSNTLVTLHLENAWLSGRPVLLIVAALKMNTTLRELFLADNCFVPMDALQIANLLKFNRILQLLDLRNNPIQDIGLAHLSAGLMAQSNSSGLNGPVGGLQTLVLWNNQISKDGMIKLALALRHTVSLATLNLGQNAIGDDGMLRLKEGLLQNHSLLRLGLVGTRLSDEGAVAVAEYLAESPRIIRLDLRNNDIKVAGLMALSLAFKINSSLLRLDIDKPNKKDELKELAIKQESLMSDMVIYAARNKEAALARVQAASAKQEEARRAAEKERTEIRYMDMTNTSPSSTTQSGTTCLNNSNNQASTSQSNKGAARISTVQNYADDTPEDSPEFLPRSSVSYHQVAPVMLSNSEIAKRAAAARMHPVKEESSPGRFQIEQVSSPPENLETQNTEVPTTLKQENPQSQSEPDQSEPVSLTNQAIKDKPRTASSGGDGIETKEKSPDETRPATEFPSVEKSGDHSTKSDITLNNAKSLPSALQSKSASSFYGSKVRNVTPENKDRLESVDILAEKITNDVLQNQIFNATSDTSKSLNHENDITHIHQSSQQSNVTVIAKSDSQPLDVAGDPSRAGQQQMSSNQDAANDEIQNLVAMATESQSSNQNDMEHELKRDSSTIPLEPFGVIHNPVSGSTLETDKNSSDRDTAISNEPANQRICAESALPASPDSISTLQDNSNISSNHGNQSSMQYQEKETAEHCDETLNVETDLEATERRPPFTDNGDLPPSAQSIANPQEGDPDMARQNEYIVTTSEQFDASSDSDINTNSQEGDQDMAHQIQPAVSANEQFDKSSDSDITTNSQEGDQDMTHQIQPVISASEQFDASSDSEPGELAPVNGKSSQETSLMQDMLSNTQNNSDNRIQYSEDRSNCRETTVEDAVTNSKDKTVMVEEDNISPVDTQTSNSESGFELTNEDNSIISGELSPVDVHHTILEPPVENTELSTPDSGVENFITNDVGISEHMYQCDTVSDVEIMTSNFSDTKLDFDSDHSCTQNRGEIETNVQQYVESSKVEIDLTNVNLDKLPSGD